MYLTAWIFFWPIFVFASSNLVLDMDICEKERSECFKWTKKDRCNDQALQCQVSAYEKNTVSKNHVCKNFTDGKYDLSLETNSRWFVTRNDNFLKANNKIYYPVYSTPNNLVNTIMDVNCENVFETDLYEYDCTTKKARDIDPKDLEFSAKRKMLYCGVQLIAYKNNEFTFSPRAYEVHWTPPAIRKVTIQNKWYVIKPLFLSRLQGRNIISDLMKNKIYWDDYFFSYENINETYDVVLLWRDQKIYWRFKVDPFALKIQKLSKW